MISSFCTNWLKIKNKKYINLSFSLFLALTLVVSTFFLFISCFTLILFFFLAISFSPILLLKFYFYLSHYLPVVFSLSLNLSLSVYLSYPVSLFLSLVCSALFPISPSPRSFFLLWRSNLLCCRFLHSKCSTIFTCLRFIIAQ